MGHGIEGDGTLFIRSVLEHLTKNRLLGCWDCLHLGLHAGSNSESATEMQLVDTEFQTLHICLSSWFLQLS